MARLILGLTGSVAAVRAPVLAAEFVSLGHEVRVTATEPSLHFFDVEALRSIGPAPGVPVYRDRDEWTGSCYERDSPILHIELRKWADALIVAPLDANTLAKFAAGMADNLLTCLYRAWDFSRPVVLAPAMNTLMWDSPVTRRHFRTILEDRGDGRSPHDFSLDELDQIFARHAPGIVVVPPVSKKLACGDIGVGGMAEIDAIAAALRRILNEPS